MQPNSPDSAFFFSFSIEGMLEVLQSNERMWTVVRSDSMTYWNDGLIEPDFRPVEGELSPAHESHFLSCWELEKRHGEWPQRGAEWIHRAFFSGGGWGGLTVDVALLCLLVAEFGKRQKEGCVKIKTLFEVKVIKMSLNFIDPKRCHCMDVKYIKNLCFLEFFYCLFADVLGYSLILFIFTDNLCRGDRFS